MFKLNLPVSLIKAAAVSATFDITDRIGQLQAQTTAPTASQHRELLKQRAVAKRLADAATQLEVR